MGQASVGNLQPVASPLSQRPPEKIRDLSRGLLRDEIGRYFNAQAPGHIVETDYSIWRCTETGLEFSDPPQPGNAAFYEWVSRFPHYYPGIRWEYGKVAGLLRSALQAPCCRILDVGSGKGDFLQSLQFLPAESRVALDMNEPAIRVCREKGFSAFCGTVESGLADGFLRPGGFAAVTSFHCLEHVGKPLEFVGELAKLVAPGGRIYISTPASPMSFESGWFDVLNHPPHHLTRWNLAAYRKLASLLDLELRHFVPPTAGWKQALALFSIRKYGPTAKVSRPALLADLLRDWKQFLSDWHQMRDRAAGDPLGGSDVVLVELTVSG